MLIFVAQATHQHSYKLPNPPTRATPNILCKILLYRLLLVIILINNLIYIISTYLYFSNTNLLNHEINKNKNKNIF